MKRFLLIMMSVMFLVSTTFSQTQKVESIYTDLAEKYCKTIESEEKGDRWYRGQCPGLAGYKLEVIGGDRMTLNVISPNGKTSELEFDTKVSGSFSELGLKAEWRVIREEGKVRPIALIVRFDAMEDIRNHTKIGFHKATSRLVIIKISNDSACITDVVEPVKNQNVKARQLAQAAAGKPCQTVPPNEEQMKLEIRDFVSRADQTFEKTKKELTVKVTRQNKKFLIEESNFNIKKGEILTRKFSYTMKEKDIELLAVHYQVGEVSAEETCYFKDKKLTYATEEHFFENDGETNNVWSGVYYLAEGTIFDISTNGHGKSETDDWDPDREVPQMCRLRTKQLKMYLARKKSR